MSGSPKQKMRMLEMPKPSSQRLQQRVSTASASSTRQSNKTHLMLRYELDVPHNGSGLLYYRLVFENGTEPVQRKAATHRQVHHEPSDAKRKVEDG
jgi:hypothetical protein